MSEADEFNEQDSGESPKNRAGEQLEGPCNGKEKVEEEQVEY